MKIAAVLSVPSLNSHEWHEVGRGRDWLGRVKSEFDPNRLFTISLAELKVAITI